MMVMHVNAMDALNHLNLRGYQRRTVDCKAASERASRCLTGGLRSATLSHVNRLPLPAVLFACVLALGCRQADGAIPSLDEEGTNRVADLGRDLRAIARGESDANGGFAAGLSVFVDEGDSALAAVRAFGVTIESAVAAARFTDESAEQLAKTAWMVVDATELSERQVKDLQRELRGHLIGVGVSEAQADAVVAAVPTVQRAVTTRPRRWYEVL